MLVCVCVKGQMTCQQVFVFRLCDQCFGLVNIINLSWVMTPTSGQSHHLSIFFLGSSRITLMSGRIVSLDGSSMPSGTECRYMKWPPWGFSSCKTEHTAGPLKYWLTVALISVAFIFCAISLLKKNACTTRKVGFLLCYQYLDLLRCLQFCIRFRSPGWDPGYQSHDSQQRNRCVNRIRSSHL